MVAGWTLSIALIASIGGCRDKAATTPEPSLDHAARPVIAGLALNGGTAYIISASGDVYYRPLFDAVEPKYIGNFWDGAVMHR